MNADAPPCRADHIGSLLRPKRLKVGFRQYQTGDLEPQAFQNILDSVITETIARQESAGLGVVTDGEFRRRSWFAGFVDSVEGLVHETTHFNFTDASNDDVSVPVPQVAAPIRRTAGIATNEFDQANQVATLPVKITLPAPSVMHFFRGPQGTGSVYADTEQFWLDLVNVYRQEIVDLAERGCTYVQLDEVPIALLCDPTIRDRISQWNWNWELLLEKYIWAMNEILHDRPQGMTIGMHLCRGNYRGHWIGSGGYEPVAEQLFNRTNVDLFLLEYESDRAGDFSPLRFMPTEKSVVLGLVSSKTPVLEAPTALARRLEEASKYVPMERLAISPQCGFGTTVGGAPMNEDEQWRKLTLVAEIADDVW